MIAVTAGARRVTEIEAVVVVWVIMSIVAIAGTVTEENTFVCVFFNQK